MFDSYLAILDDDEFEEHPVQLREFLYSDDYLGLPQLSDIQERIVEAMSQIYHYDTLVKLWGREEADRLRKATFREVILMLGKGSGKDFTSTIAFAYVIYLLLCLKEPAKYFGKPAGDSIHLLNVAINAKQANNVFFKGLLARIQGCPWFEGRYNALADNIQFDKNITAHSGHSEREAWEGYNLLMVVLDEIAGFASQSELDATASARGKSADAIYDMYRASVSSRFPKNGKLALLSFSRFKNDFMQKRYAEVIGEKVTTVRSHKFKLHDDLPDGIEHNEFTIEWEEDKIISYKEQGVWALKKPTWEVNPLIDIEDFKNDFWRKPADALTRFCNMPPDAIDAMFKDVQKVERAFKDIKSGPFNEDWSFRESFVPKENTKYYLHVDLGYSHDRAAVALAHVSEWVLVNYGNNNKHYEPMIVLDAVRWWTPTREQNVDFNEIEKYVVGLKHRGFDIELCTFDRWSSVQFRQRLERDYGMQTDLLSVAKPHYEDLAVAIQEERLIGYDLPIAREEILGLRIIRGNKVDHPSKGSKDVSDAIAGAVYNAVRYTTYDVDQYIEVEFMTPAAPKGDYLAEKKKKQNKPKTIPTDIRDFLEGWEIF